MATKAHYTGIEEAAAFAREMPISDYKSAFLFLKRTTGQIFTQLSMEETNKPSHPSDANLLYCGQLMSDYTYDDILQMVIKAVDIEEANEAFIEWLTENGCDITLSVSDNLLRRYEEVAL